MDFLFELAVEPPAAGSRSRAKDLYRQLRSAILEARLPPGAKLPPTRAAPGLFAVSRNTAAEVYERLLHEGLVDARQGSGTYVAERPPPRPEPAEDAAEGPPDARLNPIWTDAQFTSGIRFWREPPRQTQAAGAAIDLRPALIDPALFPLAAFRKVMARQLRRMETQPPGFRSPQGNQGNYLLRRAIARHIGLTRALACDPSEILVSSGAQQAFDLLARILVRHGETVVAIEDPGYPPMRMPFAAAGARLVAVPVDEEGIVVDAIPPDVNVICVCPSHHFPLGLSMSPARRKALVDLARARGAVIVEDDYDGEFRHEGSPLDALRSREAADVVFYVGTFSKTMLPALRLGFVVAPAWALPSLVAAKNSTDWHCSTPLQTSVAAFIAEGHLTRHVGRMRQVYGKRRAFLAQMLETEFPQWLAPVPSAYGMHLAATARAGMDEEAVAAALLERGVKIHGLARYHFGPATRSGLVFGFGTAGIPALREAATALRDVLAR